MKDVYFDGVAEAFNSSIYGTSKGFIRLGVLWEDLRQGIPVVETKKLRILDVGGGMGQIALRLAKFGHDIVLVDPSTEMLAKSRLIIEEEDLRNVSVIRSTAQDLSNQLKESFDLVICHAVLEWVSSPEMVIKALSQFVKEDGTLSLMFLNQNTGIFKAALRGDFESFASSEVAERAENNLPEKPPEGVLAGARSLRTKSITNYLSEQGFNIRSQAGIRIFHDYIAEDLKQDRLAELLTMEINYRNIEPFASLGQHTHLLCSRR